MEEGLSSRAKRQKLDKGGRFAALEKLKQLKGSKHKYEISGVENVYEEVDEREYSKKVLERQDDDWIVDDDGAGYVEDGRDIFDDDLDDESINNAARNKNKELGHGKKGKRSSKAVNQEAGSSGSKSIRSMLMNMPTRKKKEAPVKLEDDEILGDIMQELHGCPSSNSLTDGSSCVYSVSPLKEKLSATAAYLRSFAPLSSAKSNLQQKPVTPKRVKLDESDLDKDCDSASNKSNKDNEEPDTALPSKEEASTAITEFDHFDHFNSNDDFPDTTDLGEVDKEVEAVRSASEESKEAPKLEVEVKASSVQVNSTPETRVTKDLPLSGWQAVMCESRAKSKPVPTRVEFDSIPEVTSESGDQVLRMYWWDAYEDHFKQPGVIYLFGKVWAESASSYVSCCLIIRDVLRQVYFLPREEHYDLKTKCSTGKEVTMVDVFQEFSASVAEKRKIFEFKSRRVERGYAFEVPGVPAKSEYLQVNYSAKYPALPPDLEGETFSHVFGTNSSALELFLLNQRVKGPCWLEVKGAKAVANPVSWCKLEVEVEKPEMVTVSTRVAPPPPLVVATLNLRSVVNPKSHQSEVVMLSCLVHQSFHVDKAPPQPPFQEHFCVMTHPSDLPWPYNVQEAITSCNITKLEKVDSERTLLNFFLAKLSQMDPDLLVGHDIMGYGLDILIHRMVTHKIPHWSKMGRLRRSNVHSNKGIDMKLIKSALCGRLVCDIKISAKELIRSRSYDLETLCSNVLHVKEEERIEFTADEVRKMYTTPKLLLQLVQYTMQDAWYIIRLMCELSVIPLALQITNIAGNVMSRTLLGGRSERNEFLLLHAFTEREFILPDKKYQKSAAKAVQEPDEEGQVNCLAGKSKNRKKPAYVGGLVLEPRKGFYDKFVLLMDFNSLYPSIIQEYNICFTTVAHASVPTTGDEEEEVKLPEPGLEPGVLSTEIRKLVESRREVKKLLVNPDLSSDLRMQYNIRQMALKLTANSMYGCLGFSHSRFFAKPLAALVTAKGREILMNTKQLVEKMNYDVIYGDTDSIMINTNCVDYEEVFKIGSKIKTEVNKLYRQVELEIDGVFKYMLLLKKKKYAAVTISRHPNGEYTTQKELKGLDIVRRDWSQISAEAGKFILEQILSDQGPDERVENIHAHLRKLRDDLESGRVPLQLLTVTKQLTKNVEEYADKKALAHVQVAMRINSKGGKRLRQGDTVAYVICEDGSGLAATQRAYHIDELKANDSLKVDVNYYLSQQIHPVVSRLCDPIEGTDACRIAECLGLDPSKYQQQTRRELEEKEVPAGEAAIISDEERFMYCDKFTFLCQNEDCRAEIKMDGPYSKDGSSTYLTLEKCPNPDCAIPPVQYLSTIQNRLSLTMRKYIHKYYLNWLICEDPGCPNHSRRLSLRFAGNYPVCHLCGKGVMYKEYTGKDLYTQLCYFQNIFDLSRNKVKGTEYRIPSNLETAYIRLKEQVDAVLLHSAYCVVNLGRLFENIMFLSKPEKPAVKSEGREPEKEVPSSTVKTILQNGSKHEAILASADAVSTEDGDLQMDFGGVTVKTELESGFNMDFEV